MPHLSKALLFDLGGVIFDISFDEVFEVWSRYSGIHSDILKSRFVADEVYKGHERGELEASDYFASVRKMLDIDLSDERFIEGWNAIFLGEFRKAVKSLSQLKGKVPLYAFSNINLTHKQFVTEHYSNTLFLFDHVFFSCDIGLRKPESDAFAFIASETGFDFKDMLFFDDTETNVLAAQALGIQAVLVKSPKDIVSSVEPFL